MPVETAVQSTQGCLTTGAWAEPSADEATTARVLQGLATGSGRLELAVVTCASGRRVELGADGREALIFILEGSGRLLVADEAHALEPLTGVLVPSQTAAAIEVAGPRELAMVMVSLGPSPGEGSTRVATTGLAEQEARAATGDRSFRIVHGPETGSCSATQFVGFIPPGRAPDHFHEYDEVIYVLAGEGILHMEGHATPFRAGATIHLPPRLVHCLENVGDGPMEVLGVFTPGGSPSDAFYPDGSRAYYDP